MFGCGSLHLLDEASLMTIHLPNFFISKDIHDVTIYMESVMMAFMRDKGFTKHIRGVGEMVHQLRALAAAIENPGSRFLAPTRLL